MTDFASMSARPSSAGFQVQRAIGVLDRGIDGHKGLDAEDAKNLAGISAKKKYPLEVCDFEEAFAREWPNEALFVCYVTSGLSEGEPLYRLNKDFHLPFVLNCHEDIHLRFMALDLDNPGHGEWSPERWDAFQAQLAAVKGDPANPFGRLLAQCAFAYSTFHGWRWVWRLAAPCPAAEAEARIRGLIKLARDAGFMVDGLFPWNHAFRLPRVTRPGGAKSSNDPFFMVEANPDLLLDWKALPEVALLDKDGKPRPKTLAVFGEGEEGEDLDAHILPEETLKDLLTSRVMEGNPPTAYFKHMKRALKDEIFYLATCETDVTAVRVMKNRHQTILDWTWKVADRALDSAKKTGATPQHVYALFLNVVETLKDLTKDDPVDSRRNWRSETWRAVLGAWTKLLSFRREQADLSELAKRQEVLAAAEGWTKLIAGVKAWYPSISSNEIEAKAWIERHALIRVPGTRGARYHVLKADGRYATDTCDADAIIPDLRRYGMAPMVPVVTVDPKGNERPKKREEFILANVATVHRVEARPEIDGSYLENPGSENPVLITLSFRRNRALTPLFSPDVDRWLRHLGGAQYEILCKHIGCMLAFERGGVAAASFNLAPGAGKKLFTHGLLEAIEHCFRDDADAHATGEDLVQRFNGKLASRPFLFVNEGLPEDQGMYHCSDTLRRTITGDSFQVEHKNVDAFNARNTIRVVMTANHDRLINALADGRELSTHEQEALGKRMIHYDADPNAAAEFLRSMGGHAWTRGWIRGDGNEPSNFVVARHFLWLWEKHGKNAQIVDRLLIEGDPNQPAIQRIRSQSNYATLISEILAKAIEGVVDTTSKVFGAPTSRPEGFEVREEDGTYWVTQSAIKDWWTRNMERSKDHLTVRKIGLALKGLSAPESLEERDPGGYLKVRVINGKRQRYHGIDVPHLLAQAEKYGWPRTELARLADIQARLRAEKAARNGHAHAPSSASATPAPAVAPSPN